MIARNPIIKAMVLSDISDKTLYNLILEYKDICMADVTEIIDKGVYGYLIKPYERVVAYILGLKRFIPEGWKPTLRVIRAKEKPDLPRQGNLDIFNSSDNRGDNHYKRKNRQDNTHLISCGKEKPIVWTQSQIERLRSLRKQGKSSSEIALMMPRTAKAIQTKLTKLGISKRK